MNAMTSKGYGGRVEYRGRTKNAMTSKDHGARMEYRGRTKNAMTSKGCAARMEYRGRTKNAMTPKGCAARMEYRGRAKNAMTSKGHAARMEYRGRTMNGMTSKGYGARVEYSDEDQCFVGHIAGIRDCVGFHSESVAGLRKAFKEAVEGYLETCAAVGKAPQKPYSGKLTVRLSPELRASVAQVAQLGGQSIN